jgi:hypothetical protein
MHSQSLRNVSRLWAQLDESAHCSCSDEQGRLITLSLTRKESERRCLQEEAHIRVAIEAFYDLEHES